MSVWGLVGFAIVVLLLQSAEHYERKQIRQEEIRQRVENDAGKAGGGRMTREQAIEVLINRYNSGVIRGRIDDEWRSATDTVIAALRDAMKRQEGCKYCAINDWERKPLATFNTYFNNYEEEQHEIGIDDYEGGYRIASTLGNNGPSVDIRFCPSCGRTLEPVGNADKLATVSKTERVELFGKTEQVKEGGE